MNIEKMNEFLYIIRSMDIDISIDSFGKIVVEGYNTGLYDFKSFKYDILKVKCNINNEYTDEFIVIINPNTEKTKKRIAYEIRTQTTCAKYGSVIDIDIKTMTVFSMNKMFERDMLAYVSLIEGRVYKDKDDNLYEIIKIG